jgi:hypothetical protein
VQRPPRPDAPLDGAADAIVLEAVGVQPLEVAQQRDRLDGGVVGQDREQIALPDLGERIGDGAPALGPPLRGRTRIGVEAPGGALGSKPARAAATRWV